MRGSINYQVNRVFRESGILAVGQSRHEAKQAGRIILAQEGKGATSANLAKLTGLHSFESARDYKDTWHTFAKYAKQEHGVKSITRLNPRHVQAYLEKRIIDGIKFGTWRKEATHLAKFGHALNRFAGRYNIPVRFDFQDQTLDREWRNTAKSMLDASEVGNKAFVAAEQVISHLPDESMALAGKLQLEGGCRLREAILVREKNLRGITSDKFTGSEVGIVHLTDTKGGKPRDVAVSRATYELLARAVERGEGIFRVGRNSYRNAVSGAAKSAGERFTGTHSFRYCFARERYVTLTGIGKLNHEQAIQQISWEMGHERADITHHYLR